METVEGYIYLVTNTVTGKKYIGQTRASIAQRWRQHVSAAKKGAEALVLLCESYIDDTEARQNGWGSHLSY